MKAFKFLLCLFAVISLLTSCQEDSPSTNTSNSNESSETPISETSSNGKVIETIDPQPFKEKDQIYAWVDKLNIREQASLQGKVIASVDSNDPLEFTGTKSGQPQTVVLRGVAYHDLFYQVKTKDGKEGWVYGGAVKRKEELKGNDPISELKFDFPYFGAFDLSQWKKISTKSEGEEIDITITIYQKGDQYLEISQMDRGEFYYGYDYKLMDKNKKVLKERSFSFSADVDLKEITETVNDFTIQPASQYIRTQKLDKHFYDLKPRPVMALGNWTVIPIEVLTINSNSPQNISIQKIQYNDCQIPGEDSGCSCNFRIGEKIQSDEIFMTNYDTDACITIDNKTYTLTGNFVRNGFDELYNNSEKEVWIELNEKGDDFLFGKKMNIGNNYEAHLKELVEVLSVMEKFPKELPMKMNGTVGMGHRANVRDLWNEAIIKVKTNRKIGVNGLRQEMVYENNDYKVTVKAKVIGKDDGGGKQYEGDLILKNKDGKIMESKKVWGGCGC